VNTHSADSIEVTVNGEVRVLRADMNVADLVERTWGRAVAVARNGEVISRAAWAATPVEPGDEIEIVRPIQGG